jgi:hypothetical protein
VRITTVIGVLLVVVPRIGTSDELFRCGSWIASADMSVRELVKRCGEPSSKQVSTEDVYSSEFHNKVGTTTIEVWRYDRGPRAAPMLVTIVDGQIRSMERGLERP